MKIIFKPFIAIFKFFYKIIDVIIVTPISRIIYKINEISKNNSGKLEKILNRPNILIYLALLCAIAVFLLIDSQVINLTEKEAEIITGQSVSVLYNDEAFVVEGVPETVDITLIGTKSAIYLASQIGDHEVILDLSNYGTGTYKVKLKYNHSVQSVNYKLDPSTVTVKISEKVSDTRTLQYDLMNQNKLDSKLSVSDVKLDTNGVVIKSSDEILKNVATVKALIDASLIDLQGSGEYDMENVPLVAYDANGNKIENIEIVPSKVSAKLTIDSYHKTKDVKVITTGKMKSGFAIANITSSVTSVEIYGEQSIVDATNYIEAKVDIDDLAKNSKISVELSLPTGIRYMSETKTDVQITVGEETEKVFTNLFIHPDNLPDTYSVGAANTDNKRVDVIIKGVKEVLDKLKAEEDFRAHINLSGLKPGTHTVPVTIEVDDTRVTAVPKTTEITVKIIEKNKK